MKKKEQESKGWIKLKAYKLKEWIIKNKNISIILGVVFMFSLYTFCLSISYFFRNEVLWGISDKYVTSKEDTIYEKADTVVVNSLNTNEAYNHKIVKNSDSAYTISFNTSKPYRHEVIRSEKESFDLGDIGDFIGGYFGFWIGIIGALLTFLAFYVQYRANRDVQKQFRLQQFENQLHKMIDVYLNNKDKFSNPGYKNPQNKAVDLNEVDGKTLLLKLETLQNKETPKKKAPQNLSLLSFNNNYIFNDSADNRFIEYHTRDHLVFQKFLVELKAINRIFTESYKTLRKKKEGELSEDVKKELFVKAYRVFFDGLNKFSNDDSRPQEDYVADAIGVLKAIREVHRRSGTKIFKNFYKDKNEIDKNLWLKLNYEPFKGYLHFLPQYFRGLYSIVNFVVNGNEDLNLSKDQKKIYLRTVRSTMSDYEQTLLFYNWYGNFGSRWEDQKNKFFTDFKMIHNLRRITLIDNDLDVKNLLKLDDDDFIKAFDGFYE